MNVIDEERDLPASVGEPSGKLPWSEPRWRWWQGGII